MPHSELTFKASETHENLILIVESLLFSSSKAMSIDQLLQQLQVELSVSRSEIRQALADLQNAYKGRAIELVEVSSGYRFQTLAKYSAWVSRLWQEKPQKYSRALLETLSLIAYKQPITRGDIEEVRGVAVSSTIMKTLLERHWVRVVGHREVPGRPAIYATTKQFLDYFNLKSLDQLPALAEIRDIDTISKEVAQQLELDTNTIEVQAKTVQEN